MQDLLENFRVRDQSLGVGDETLEENAGPVLERVRSPHEEDLDVGVHEDHVEGSSPWPWLISASMSSISAVGNSWSTASAMAESFV